MDTIAHIFIKSGTSFSGKIRVQLQLELTRIPAHIPGGSVQIGFGQPERYPGLVLGDM
ncbi:MAG: hypothetical protein GY702_27010 [Desulfobulbaceae bacterium]|nr:hypothetical protein [Desulfobulbaceae bacterium]